MKGSKMFCQKTGTDIRKVVFTKRNTGLILIMLLASILTAGCTGSTNNSQTSSPQPTPVATPTQPVNQDSEWILSFQKYAPLVYLDAKNLKVDSQSSGRTSELLRGDTGTLIIDIKVALKENDQYTISPKYNDAQNEWVQALNDFNSSGNSMLDIIKGLQYPASGDARDNYYTKMESGNSHLKRAVTLFNAETGSSIDLK
jgi:outer membrane PBP1 activator LpoA protein